MLLSMHFSEAAAVPHLWSTSHAGLRADDRIVQPNFYEYETSDVTRANRAAIAANLSASLGSE